MRIETLSIIRRCWHLNKDHVILAVTIATFTMAAYLFKTCSCGIRGLAGWAGSLTAVCIPSPDECNALSWSSLFCCFSMWACVNVICGCGCYDHVIYQLPHLFNNFPHWLSELLLMLYYLLGSCDVTWDKWNELPLSVCRDYQRPTNH